MLARILLALWILAMAVILFEPHPQIASGTVNDVAAFLTDHGVSTRIATGAHVEAFLNAGMFLPPAFLAMLSWRRLHWADLVAFAFIGSMAVETIQAFFLSARSAQTVDVVSNTTGALAGALLAEWARRTVRARVKGRDASADHPGS